MLWDFSRRVYDRFGSTLRGDARGFAKGHWHAFSTSISRPVHLKSTAKYLKDEAGLSFSLSVDKSSSKALNDDNIAVTDLWISMKMFEAMNDGTTI